MSPALVLWADASHALATVEPALAHAAALVIAPAHPERAALVAAAQDEGCAALIDAAAAPFPRDGDGAHLTGALASQVALLKARPADLTVGALAPNRHAAMTLGEAGADYVWFQPDADTTLAEALENAAWWQPLFEVPVVMAGPCRDIAALVGTHAEFIAPVDLFDAADPAAALDTVLKALQNTAP